MTVEPDKPSVSELAHYGVKGMRWGMRKRPQPANPNYSQHLKKSDSRQHGSRAVKRINQRMNEGVSREKALEKEHARDDYQRLALMGATIAVGLIAKHGDVAMSHIATRADANRAAAKVAGISSAAEKVKYVKPRSGVHKVTTMK